MGSGEGGDYSGKPTRLLSSLWAKGGRGRDGEGRVRGRGERGGGEKKEGGKRAEKEVGMGMG